ncbi:MAG: peptide deformylase [Bdellovibrionaceae bacterium]|nr:peptide deformylase [Pseudobdellovibrionaceae bacterium]
MILEILKFPDPRLREKSEPITEFGPELQQLASDMLETMYAEHGIGLAAPQVGVLKQMLVIDCRPKDENGQFVPEEMTELERQIGQPLVILNPRIVKKEGKTTYDEGCLSVPTFYDTVERALIVELEYETLKGETKRLRTDGLLAIVIQHEMDHLEGTLFIDRISFIKSNKIKNQIKKHGYPEKKKAELEVDDDKVPSRR